MAAFLLPLLLVVISTVIVTVTLGALKVTAIPDIGQIFSQPQSLLDSNGKIPIKILPTGHGSGLDADLLDGEHATFFAKAVDLNNLTTKVITLEEDVANLPAPVATGVAKLNGLTGNITIVAGTGIVAISASPNINLSLSAVPYSALNLSGSIVNADIASTAAITYGKLSLGSSITSADIVNGTIVGGDLASNISISTSGNITAGTYNGNTFSSTALTLSGANPIISASTTNTTLDIKANGTGALTFNSGTTGDIQFFSSSNKITSSGDLDLAGHVAFGSGAAVNANRVLNVNETFTSIPALAVDSLRGVRSELVLNSSADSDGFAFGVVGASSVQSGNTRNLTGKTTGVLGFTNGNGSGTLASSYGVEGQANVGGNSATHLAGGYFNANVFSPSTATNLYGVRVTGSFISGTVTNYYGTYLDIPTNNGIMTNAYGLYIADHSGLSVSGEKYNFYSAGTNSQNYFAGTLASRHYKAVGTAPTVGTPSSCGGSPSSAITSGSTDSAGSFTITSGSGSPTTCDTVITFNAAYGAAPKSLIITPKDSTGAAKQIYVSATSTTTFTVKFAVNAAVSTAHNFYYWVIE